MTLRNLGECQIANALIEPMEFWTDNRLTVSYHFVTAK
jgi:hypothetical protein